MLTACAGSTVDPNDDVVIDPTRVSDIFSDDLFTDDEPSSSNAGSTSSTGNKTQPVAGDTSSQPTNADDNNLVGNTYKSGFPIAKDKITLKILTYSRPEHARDWNLMRFSQEYEKMTNIHIEWSIVPQDSIVDQVKIMLQTQSYPDILIVPPAAMSDSDVYTYGTQNVLWDISGSMTTYAPNLYKLLKDEKSLRIAVQQQNGSIYSLPYIQSDYPGVTGHAWTINKKWLDDLRLDIPTTTQELENVLIAFRDRDPDGDGQANQIPLMTFCYMPEMFGPWGVYFDWAGNVMVDNNGKIQYVFTMNEMRNAVLYWKKLRTQNLISIPFTERSVTEMAQMINSGRVGMFLWNSPYSAISPDVLKDYVVIDVPKAESEVGSNITAGVMRADSHVRGNSTFIFNTSKNKEAALRWLDYFYSYEGNAFKTYLDVGYKYLKKDSSGAVYRDIAEDANTLEDTPGYVIPGIYDNYFYNGYFAQNPNTSEREKFSSEWKKTVDSLYKDSIPKYIFPDLTFNASEIRTIKKYEQYLGTNINWYCITRMIEGGSDVPDPNTAWSTWVNEKKKSGLEEYLSVFQKAYDRVK